MAVNFITQLMIALGVQRPAPVRGLGARSDRHRAPGLPPLARPRATRGHGEELKAAVWQKGQPIIGWDPSDWRIDYRSNPLFRSAYGDTGSAFGWEIGMIVARAQGGTDDIANLRPVLCQASRDAGADLGTTLDLDPFGR